ncbi:MAG TPA: hypothetical protein CFH82_08750 [Sulfurospirillum sp. UBA12182]|nr:MAG TPA: hypothetical protein CFH82_08750 [Sulfurospirillum sp. UBA12182]
MTDKKTSQRENSLFFKFIIKLRYEEIASDLGTSRVVVSRILKDLKNDGKLKLYRRYIQFL